MSRLSTIIGVQTRHPGKRTPFLVGTLSFASCSQFAMTWTRRARTVTQYVSAPFQRLALSLRWDVLLFSCIS